MDNEPQDQEFTGRLSDEQRRRIHAAMEAAAGCVADAARILNMPYKTLYGQIKKDRELSARWKKDGMTIEPPTEAVTLHRDSLLVKCDPPPLARDEEVALAIKKEDAAIRNGLESIGARGKTLDMALALQSFHKKHFSSALDLMGGGITKQFLDVMVAIESITAILDSSEELEMDREQMLREDRSRLLDMLNKFYDRGNQAVLTRAKVNALANDKKDAKPSKPKGFLAINAQPGSNVKVSVDGDDTKVEAGSDV